jgi:hypothetical protein
VSGDAEEIADRLQPIAAGSVPGGVGRSPGRRVWLGALQGLCWLLLCCPSPSAAAPRQEPSGIEELEAQLRGEDVGKRRSAVGRLADLGSQRAWELVLEALTDPEPEVADRAQRELCRIDVDLARELLPSRAAFGSRDDAVRRRVAEALGRATRTVAGAELLPALEDRDAEVRRLGLWSVERLALRDPGALTEREKLESEVQRLAKSERDPATRGAALITAATLGLPAASAADALAPREREPLALRCASLLAMGRARAPGAAQRIASVLGGEDAPQSLRAAGIRALEELGDRDAAQALAHRLSSEPSLRLSLELVSALQGLSGLRHGRNARAWAAWAQELPDDWRAQPARAPLETGETVASLAGLPVLSDRLCVLIDMSGSMWQTRADGRTLKTLVDAELRRFLETLPETARFNLIPYAHEPGPFEDRLVDASPRNVARALAWFEENRQRGRGAVWEAVELALQDPEVDTLIVLTDGAPTGGLHWDLQLIVELLLERNRFRQVAFDSILTDPKPQLLARWRALAEGSGGVSAEIRFDEP